MIRYNKNDNGRHLVIEGIYEENIICLRGILIVLSENFGISPYEFLEYAVMSDKEEGTKVKCMDVVFHFSGGNTYVMHLTDMQQKAVEKILGVFVSDGELICADDFFVKDGN